MDGHRIQVGHGDSARLGTVAHAQGDDGGRRRCMRRAWHCAGNSGTNTALPSARGPGGGGGAQGTWNTPHGFWVLQRPCARRSALPCRPASVSGMTVTCLAVQAGLDEATFAAAWATGKAMPPEQVITHGS